MKKTALSIGMIVLGVSFTSQADTLLGLYAGAQGWNMQTSGNMFPMPIECCPTNGI